MRLKAVERRGDPAGRPDKRAARVKGDSANRPHQSNAFRVYAAINLQIRGVSLL